MVEYEVELFRREGFKRRRCPSCRRFFWSLDEERIYCGDQPCVEYGFIGNPPTRGRYSLKEVREKFLSFFERNGHRRIGRYPVVARWREDVYLVGASIYAFQPWVTEGISPPPANPLTVSQPCIRLTDLSRVGRTGRHLTSFEMMAHHAFNKGDEEIYWKDETVEYCFRFYVEELGVKPEEISFIEDWWSGGGNAGEDFEVTIGGAEVATLVFMHYRDRNGVLEEMPIRVVDTGYGLERNVWVSTGYPTVYDAVHREFLERIRVEAGIPRVEEDILKEFSKASGMIEAYSQIESKVASNLGLTVEELREKLKPYTLLYALADHTYTIAWMLSDGIVPSNTGAGYLARLLIRRSLRFMRDLGLTLTLPDLVSFQVDRIAESYPEVKLVKPEVLDMVEVESKRYKRTLSEAPTLIERRVKTRGKPKLTVEDLVELYDSHGLPPEIVEEYASKLGVEVERKGDFYDLLASRHSKPVEARTGESKPAEPLRDLPPTRPLYYEDPETLRFKAKVLKSGEDYVILDATSFYPEGGGAVSDTGILKWDTGRCRVVHVDKIGEVIVHKVEGGVPPVGVEVEGVVDEYRRWQVRRHHTATHIILGAARRILGAHVWQMGSLKSVDYARLDISHYKRLTGEEVRAIEAEANRIVREARPIHVRWMPREEAEAKYGFTLYQGGVFPGKTLRIVEVEGWDVEACGGIHCSNTSQVGFVKLTGSERIQDGVERINFAAGDAALNYVNKIESIVREAADILSSPVDKVPVSVKNLLAELRELRREARRLRERLAELEAEGIPSRRRLRIHVKRDVTLSASIVEEDVDTVIKIGEKLIDRNPNLITVFFIPGERYRLVVMAGGKAQKNGYHAGRIASAIAETAGGGGGGKGRLGQGGRLNPEAAEKLASSPEKLAQLVESTLN